MKTLLREFPGGSAQRRDRASGVLPDILEHLPPKTRVCLLYCLCSHQMEKNLPAVFNPWVGKISWRRKWQPTPVFLPGEFHGHRSLVGYSKWGRKELDMTERLTHTHTLWKQDSPAEISPGCSCPYFASVSSVSRSSWLPSLFAALSNWRPAL